MFRKYVFDTISLHLINCRILYERKTVTKSMESFVHDSLSNISKKETSKKCRVLIINSNLLYVSMKNCIKKHLGGA